MVELRLESFTAPSGLDAGGGEVGTGGAGFPPAERPHLLAILSDGSLLLYRAARRQVTHASGLPPYRSNVLHEAHWQVYVEKQEQQPLLQGKRRGAGSEPAPRAFLLAWLLALTWKTVCCWVCSRLRLAAAHRSVALWSRRASRQGCASCGVLWISRRMRSRRTPVPKAPVRASCASTNSVSIQSCCLLALPSSTHLRRRRVSNDARAIL